MNKSKSIVLLCIAVAVILFVAVFTFMPTTLKTGNYDYHSPVNQLAYAYELSNGNYVTYKIEGASDKEKLDKTLDVLQKRMRLIEERLGVGGFSNAVLSVSDNAISIDMPADKNISINTIFDILGKQGELAISLKEDGSNPMIPYDNEKNELSWSDCITKCIAIYDNSSSKASYGISMTVNDFGLEALKAGTAEVTSNSTIYFILDGKTIGKPSISSQITNKTNQITGLQTPAEAQTLSIQFITGKYPLKITNTSNIVTISAVAGKNAFVVFGIALAAMVVVFIMYSIVKYRLFGVAMTLSLLCCLIILAFAYAYLPLGQVVSIAALAGFAFAVATFMLLNLVFAEFVTRRFESSDKKTFDTAVAEAFRVVVKLVLDVCIPLLIAAILVWIIASGVAEVIAMAMVFALVITVFCTLILTKASFKNLHNVAGDKHFGFKEVK